MSSDNKKIKKIIAITTAVTGGTFITLKVIGNVKKGKSVFLNEPEQQNAMVGKKVIFVQDDTEPENADGVRGHLEAVGDIEHIPGFYEKYIKRAIDVVLSFGGLVVLAPVYAGIALAIIIDDPGPVLFTQKRVGQNKEYFKLHKFRSMKMSTPHDVPTHMLENPEQYITRVGKFIRAHSLDELPQIWDIFTGNMSVIGPRPGLWNQDILTAERDKYDANDVKPGLTGWAQINGRDELEIPDKAKLDGEYVNSIGPLMDLKCFLGSLGVFSGDNSVVEGGTGEMKKFVLEEVDGDIPELNQDEKVSVIMPAYNADAYISDSIISVKNQSYQNWELIVVDDCSNDNTELIVREFAEKDQRIKYIRNTINEGVAKTRNKGIDVSSGRYIAFLDSDDIWVPEKLEIQLKFMMQKKCVFSFSSYQKFDSMSGKLGKVIYVPAMISADEVLGNTIIGCLTVMYDSCALGKIYMPNIDHMEDNVTWYSILKRGYNAYGISEILAKYREGNNSLTMNKANSAKKQWNIYRQYFGFSLIKSTKYFLKYALNALKKHY